MSLLNEAHPLTVLMDRPMHLQSLPSGRMQGLGYHRMPRSLESRWYDELNSKMALVSSRHESWRLMTQNSIHPYDLQGDFQMICMIWQFKWLSEHNAYITGIRYYIPTGVSLWVWQMRVQNLQHSELQPSLKQSKRPWLKGIIKFESLRGWPMRLINVLKKRRKKVLMDVGLSGVTRNRSVEKFIQCSN